MKPIDCSPISGLVSFSSGANDLYNLLVRMSLSDDQSPSLATRHAISALSYQHLHMKKAAIAHQTSAIIALRMSIEDLRPSQAMQAMAASMLLSIFEVRNLSLDLQNFVALSQLTKLYRPQTSKPPIPVGPFTSVVLKESQIVSPKNTTLTLPMRP
jgi:hypothetical protein